MSKEFKWVAAAQRPEEGLEVLLAVPDKTEDVWLYMMGSFYKEGYEFELASGGKDIVKKDGYFVYSNRFDRLLPMINVSYWTYIQEPADISEELIIDNFY